MSKITTHVLDTARGRPAAGVPIKLDVREGGAWRPLGGGVTDGDGRLRTLLSPEEPLPAATYRLLFDTSSYHRRNGGEGFFPEVSIVFEVREADAHHHVPLLLSPFGYSTYRGS